MNKKLWSGVILIFIAGLINSQIISSILIYFTGGGFMDNTGHVIEPEQSFYNNTLYQFIYSIPFIVVGIYLIRCIKNQKS